MTDQLPYDVIEDGLNHPADPDDQGTAAYELVRHRTLGIYALRTTDGSGTMRTVDQRWGLARHLVLRRAQRGEALGLSRSLSQPEAVREIGISLSALCKYEQGRSSPTPLYRQAIDRWLMKE